MLPSYASRVSVLAQSYYSHFQKKIHPLDWRDLLGVLSLIAYLLISVLAVINIKDDLQSYDSTLMLKMAKGEEEISSTLGPPYILFLRFMINTLGESGIIYLHYFAAAIAGLLLVYVFGRKHLLSWSGLWILSTPSYLILNQMIWRDVLFLYLISIAVALLIKADRDKLNVRNIFVVITALLTATCLIRLNGITVSCLMIGAFCINKTNIRAKLIALSLTLALAVSTNAFINKHYQVVQSKITTKYMIARMVENDYLYYALCVSSESMTDLPIKDGKIYAGLLGYCDNSYHIDTVKRLLPIVEQESLYNRSISFFSHKPYLWLLVKYKQADQYLNMNGAFVFPASVMRLDFLNTPEFKEKSTHHEALAGWMNRNFSSILQFTFQPFWIALFVLYIALRAIFFKFVLAKNNAEQNNILLPAALFSALYYMSLALPSMTNDTRYFLPATFLSSFMLLNTVFADLRLAGIGVISFIKEHKKI